MATLVVGSVHSDNNMQNGKGLISLATGFNFAARPAKLGRFLTALFLKIDLKEKIDLRIRSAFAETNVCRKAGLSRNEHFLTDHHPATLKRRTFQGEIKMARAYAARLGCIAMVFGLLEHFVGNSQVGQTEMHAVILLLVFSGLGYVIGSVAEELIRQTVEANFRRSVEKSTSGSPPQQKNPK